MIDVDKLVQEELQKDSEWGTALRSQQAAGAQHYDDIDVVAVLTDYINTHDMFYELEKYNDNNTKKGYVIFNFPKNVHQAQLFQTTGHICTRIFHLVEEDYYCKKMYTTYKRKSTPDMSDAMIEMAFEHELN
jgi:adenylate kinase family enzyme